MATTPAISAPTDRNPLATSAAAPTRGRGGFDLFDKFFRETQPQIVFEWHDRESSAVGFVAMNSLRGGAAGGGTRLKPYPSHDDARREAVNLAKTMEMKFRVCGPAIGGGKSVIDYDPGPGTPEERLARKRGVLQRWYRAVKPFLAHCYGTGGDVGVSDDLVIELFREIGLDDPQGGIVRGHFGRLVDQRVDNLQRGVSLEVDEIVIGRERFKVNDLITGYGVAKAAYHYFDLRSQSIDGKRVVVEGFGNVGAAAAYLLAADGAKVVGITSAHPQDRSKILAAFATEGRSLAVDELLLRRRGTELHESDACVFDRNDPALWTTPADVFVPAAISETIDRQRLAWMRQAGVKLIVPGANVPFRVSEAGLDREADAAMAVVPDFVANCGMARCFAYLMESPNADISWRGIAQDTERCIRRGLERIWDDANPDTGFLDRAYATYLDGLVI